MENVTEKFAKRIGSKDKRDYNFMRESQEAEMEENKKIVILTRRVDRGIESIEMILEPNKFDELSSKVRLSFDEYCEVINDLIEEEEAEWDELRMKDQINITRDAILQSTMLKYVKEEYQVDSKEFSGRDVNYMKRYDGEGRFLGEATLLTLTRTPMTNVRK